MSTASTPPLSSPESADFALLSRAKIFSKFISEERSESSSPSSPGCTSASKSSLVWNESRSISRRRSLSSEFASSNFFFRILYSENFAL